MKTAVSVKISGELLDTYRKLSGITLMPVSRMIERAMEDWIPAYESLGRELQKGLRNLKKLAPALLILVAIFLGGCDQRRLPTCWHKSQNAKCSSDVPPTKE